MNKKKLGVLAVAAVIACVAVYPVLAQLSVTISTTGTVAGQTKELTIPAQTAVAILGSATVLPTCAAQAASTFADVATASLNWGTSLRSNTDYEPLMEPASALAVSSPFASTSTLRPSD